MAGMAEFPPARILGIESSCDETAAAVVVDGRQVVSSVVASQADLHAQYGGVFPEVASRQHITAFMPVVEQALKQAHMDFGDLDALAVTCGPGLAGSLVVGINIAKGIVLGTGLPLVGVNHLEAHLYSAWVHDYSNGEEPPPPPEFPLVALLVSGGHTELVLMSAHLQYQHLGGTRDDAAGEAFDKVARLLGLGYPGGPTIQNAAQGGNPTAFNFPRAWLEDSWDFSFSGLKTAVLREVKVLEAKAGARLPVADLAASFQTAVVDVLTGKTRRAAQVFQAKAVLVAGGVSANLALRTLMQKGAPGRVHIPPIDLCTDNAAMVAAAGYYRYVHGQRDGLDMDARPTYPLMEL
jgi:N6-L-threonylcarbamoyladenine synthase